MPKSETTAHTPGPWVWRWKSGSLHRVGESRPYGETVLSPTRDYDSGDLIEVSDADSALIAAAPDLLDAAIKAINECCDLIGTSAGNDLIAAIAKAKGNNNGQ